MTLYHYYAQVIAPDGFCYSHANGCHTTSEPLGSPEAYKEACAQIRQVVMDNPNAADWQAGTTCIVVSISRLN